MFAALGILLRLPIGILASVVTILVTAPVVYIGSLLLILFGFVMWLIRLPIDFILGAFSNDPDWNKFPFPEVYNHIGDGFRYPGNVLTSIWRWVTNTKRR